MAVQGKIFRRMYENSFFHKIVKSFFNFFFKNSYVLNPNVDSNMLLPNSDRDKFTLMEAE